MKNSQQLLSDAGLRCLAKAQGNFTVWVKPGHHRVVLLQEHNTHDGFEIHQPCSEENDIDSTIKAAARYLESGSPTGALTYAELSTILAALRYWQRHAVDFSHFEQLDIEPLGDEEIDSLCERLNCGEIVSITGGPKG